MKKVSTLPTLILASVFLLNGVNAQTDQPQLSLGMAIERTITSTDVHTFSVNLTQGQLLKLVVDQRGLDVVIRISSPDGKVIGSFDSPNGTSGPELVEVVTDSSGDHRIDIIPFSQPGRGPSAGRYELKVVELREATQKEFEQSKAQRGLFRKALGLLDMVVEQAPSLQNAENRSLVEAYTADLLWPYDQERSRQLFTEAVNSLNEEVLMAQPREQRYSSALVLQQEILQMIGRYDPQLALALMRKPGTQPPGLSPDQQEMNLAVNIASTNPQKALEIAEKSLAKGFSEQLMPLLSRLGEKDSEAASKLAGAILKKLLSTNLSSEAGPRYLAIRLLQMAAQPQAKVAVSSQDQAAASKVGPILDQQGLQDLAQSVAVAALTLPSGSFLIYEMSNLLPAIEKYAPADAAPIRRKMDEASEKLRTTNPTIDPSVQKWTEQRRLNESGTPEDLIAFASKAPPEMQQSSYSGAVRKALLQGNLELARQIIRDHIVEPGMRAELTASLNNQFLERAISGGKIDETRQLLPLLRTAEERSRALSRLAVKLADGGSRTKALQLMDEARNLVSGEPANSRQLLEQVWIARAYLMIEPAAGLEIIETAVRRLNELSTAAEALDGFLQQEKSFKDGELMLRTGFVSNTIYQPVAGILGPSARLQFDRTRAVVDRIEKPGLRLLGYLRMAAGVLSPQSNMPLASGGSPVY
jgi:hypothetical protein